MATGYEPIGRTAYLRREARPTRCRSDRRFRRQRDGSQPECPKKRRTLFVDYAFGMTEKRLQNRRAEAVVGAFRGRCEILRLYERQGQERAYSMSYRDRRSTI